MRKLYLLGIVLVCLTVFIQTAMVANAQQETPPAYAKWGQMAIKEVKAKYPSAKIIDYLHEGKEVHGASTIEKFKLWLKQPDKEFGVYVRISYQSATQKVEKLNYKKARHEKRMPRKGILIHLIFKLLNKRTHQAWQIRPCMSTY